MVAITVLPECPHCHSREITFYLLAQTGFHPYVSAWICANCKRGIYLEGHVINHNGNFPFKAFNTCYPAPDIERAPEFTPEQAAHDFEEAASCLRTGNYKAASIMARASLEAAVKSLEAKGNNLKEKINDLAARHIITPDLADWAHEIRTIGNNAAHDGTPHTKQDAEDIIDFAEMLYIYLFTLPGRIKTRRGQK